MHKSSMILIHKKQGNTITFDSSVESCQGDLDRVSTFMEVISIS